MLHSYDKNINVFHRGWQKFPTSDPVTGYEDPTYLGFRLMLEDIPYKNYDIGYNDNPLFTKKEDPFEGAERYLEDINMPKRAAMVKRFRELMFQITKKTPWYIQSVEGVADLWKVDKNPDVFDPFRTKETILTFNCQESIDLRMTAIADLYRKASFDYKNMRELLPENLRHFRCSLQIAEFRSFHRVIEDVKTILSTEDSLAGNPSGKIPDFTKKLEPLDDFISLINFDLLQCEFDFDDSFPSDSFNVGGDYNVATQSFKIKIGRVYKERNQYTLQEILLIDTDAEGSKSDIKGQVNDAPIDEKSLIDQNKKSQFNNYSKVDRDEAASEKLETNRKSELQRRLDRGLTGIENKLSNDLSRLKQEAKNLINEKIFNSGVADFIRGFVDQVTQGELGIAYEGNPDIKYVEPSGEIFGKPEATEGLTELEEAFEGNPDIKYPGVKEEAFEGNPDIEYSTSEEEAFEGNPDIEYPGVREEAFEGNLDIEYPGVREEAFEGNPDIEYPGVKEEAFEGNPKIKYDASQEETFEGNPKIEYPAKEETIFEGNPKIKYPHPEGKIFDNDAETKIPKSLEKVFDLSEMTEEEIKNLSKVFDVSKPVKESDNLGDVLPNHPEKIEYKKPEGKIFPDDEEEKKSDNLGKVFDKE